jgi:hypothetical protein
MELSILQPFIVPAVGCVATYLFLIKKLELEHGHLKADLDSLKADFNVMRAGTETSIDTIKESQIRMDSRLSRLEEAIQSISKDISNLIHMGFDRRSK